ncbi:MAG: ABC transporter ATP-binding protein [Pseudomonadales bacterium]
MTVQSSRSLHRKIWNVLTRQERRRAALLLGLMTIGMLLETLGIGLVIPVILLITQEDLPARFPFLQPVLDALGNPSQQALIIGAMLLLVSVYMVKAVYLALLAWLQARYILAVRVRLSQRLFTVYLRQPYTFHLQRNSSQLIRNVLNEAHQFATGGLNPSLQLFAEGAMMIGICTLLLVLEPTGFLIVAAVLGTCSWMFQRSTRNHLMTWGRQRQFHEGMRVQHLRQGLNAAKDVKLLGRERDFLGRFAEHDRQSARVARLETMLRQLPRLWLELLAVLGMAGLVLTMLFQAREIAAILPTLAVFAAAAFRMLPSMNKLLGAVQQLRFGVAAIDNLNEELALAPPELPRPARTAAAFKHELSVSNVSYTYPSGSGPAVHDITLSISKGESVGFIGPSGSGKSTLIDVILGLLPPDSGTVTVDDADIHEHIRAWQDQIGYVPQSIYLTDDTLRRNVAFGLADDEIDNAAIDVAIDAAQLRDFVARLPDGLDTVVGEHGMRLSGGQRQRIGIARALYHDPAVLVLDEATSALDTATEHDVMQAVYALQGSKTILIVAHRMSTVERCDRVYRLEDGLLKGERQPMRIAYAENKSGDSRPPEKLGSGN